MRIDRRNKLNEISKSIQNAFVTYALMISGFPDSTNTDNNVQMCKRVAPNGGDKSVAVFLISFFCRKQTKTIYFSIESSLK